MEFADIGSGMRVAADKEDGLAFMRLDQFNMLIAAVRLAIRGRWG